MGTHTGAADAEEDTSWRCPLCYRREGIGHKLTCPGDQDIVIRPDEEMRD